ncbi:MAG: DUF4160 domain-containing protein [Parachlamydiales bacterium]|jgi:hypothetical protein
MYAREHNPPHIHVFCGNHEAVLDIQKLNVIEGNIPAKKLILVKAWMVLRSKELMRNWENLSQGAGFEKIEPLR